MKKLFLAAALAVSSLGFAQEVNFGIRGGLNLANGDFEVSGQGASVSIDTDIRTSFYLGGFAEFGLKDSAHKLQTGLTYHGNGLKVDDGDDVTFKISQLNVPLLFKFNAAEGLYLNGGGYLGAIIDVQGEIEFNGSTETQDITSDFKTLDAGLSIGAEYNFSNGLFIEARYNYGLVNILDTVEELDFDGVEVTLNNRFFTVGLGYKF